MAITAGLVYAGHNRLRYLITATAGGNEAVVITSTGAVSPDLLTDSLQGPIKAIASVKANGYGKIAAATVITTALARALWLSDDAAAQVGPFNGVALGNVATAICTLVPRTTATAAMSVDAGQGVDTATASLTVTAEGIGICYLDVSIPGGIGQ